MRSLPIANYDDAMEWAKAQDRIDNRSENNKLIKARKLAELYYKKGDTEIANHILWIAGQLYLNTKKIREEII